MENKGAIRCDNRIIVKGLLNNKKLEKEFQVDNDGVNPNKNKNPNPDDCVKSDEDVQSNDKPIDKPNDKPNDKSNDKSNDKPIDSVNLDKDVKSNDSVKTKRLIKNQKIIVKKLRNPNPSVPQYHTPKLDTKTLEISKETVKVKKIKKGKRIMSIDVGIKNLAYCIIERMPMEEKDPKKPFKIHDWAIINVLEDKIQNAPKCCNYLKNKVCNKMATNYLELKSDMAFCDKITCQKFMKLHYKKFKIKKLKKVNCKNTSLLEIGTILYSKLFAIKDKLLNIDEIVIENQPVLKNPTMKSIQMLLYGFFIEHAMLNDKSSVKNIKLFLARDKLKLYDGPPVECNISDKYKKRKFLSIEYTKYYIKNNTFLDFFLSHSKKDDLADSFIQGFYYLFKD